MNNRTNPKEVDMRCISVTLAGLLLATTMASAEEAFVKNVEFTAEEIAAAEQDPARFSLDPDSIRIRKIKEVPSNEIDIGLNPPPNGDALPGAKSPVDVPIDIINEIINIGERVWGIIEANQPVVDVSTTFANAYPRGVEHWTDMHSWQPPTATMYEFTAKNLLGMDAVKVRYQVIRMHGGKYKGRGNYLNHVTVEPLKVEVNWGMKFHLLAQIPSVMNVGTSEDPVAGMLATLKWQVNTVFKHSQGTSVYYVQGDGDYREIGGPFEGNLQDNGRKAETLIKEINLKNIGWN